MKNKTKKIIKILLVIMLIIALQIMGFTYAKYIAQETGTGSAEIAKWGFEIVKEGVQTKTVKLIDTAGRITLTDGKIAPGTNGMITVILDALDSEVNLDYGLKFANEQNKPKNLTFSFGGRSYSSISKIPEFTGTIGHKNDDRTVKLDIYWEWKYETGATEEEIAANDIQDTQDANTIDNYTFDIIATATQSQS